MSTDTIETAPVAAPVTIPAVVRSMDQNAAISFGRYLVAAGGVDIHTFVDAKGEPDLHQARVVAELMRESMGPFCPDMFVVEQIVHKVRVTLNDALRV